MNPKERLKNYPRYPSVKGEVGYQLYKAMAENKDMWILTGDLGYKMLDQHREDFPDRFINCGASEQAMIGMAIGLALQGKKPFVYSITNFLIYRPFEWIRNYINYEKVPVRLIGGGLDKDYIEDGISHQCEDLEKVMDVFENIDCLHPTTIDSVKVMIDWMINKNKPWFMGVNR
jgi:transketolase